MSLRQAYEKNFQATSCFISQYSQVEERRGIKPDNILQSKLRSLSHTFWSLNILQGRVCPWYLGSEDGKQNSCQKQGRDRIRKGGQASWDCWLPSIMCKMYWSILLKHVPPPELQTSPSPSWARDWSISFPWILPLKQSSCYREELTPVNPLCSAFLHFCN